MSHYSNEVTMNRVIYIWRDMKWSYTCHFDSDLIYIVPPALWEGKLFFKPGQ